jgi:hypothetical protein
MGQLGYRTYTGTPFETSPQQVQLSHITNLGFNIERIDTGSYSSCAVFRAEGTYCWGETAVSARLGDGTTTDSAISLWLWLFLQA